MASVSADFQNLRCDIGDVATQLNSFIAKSKAYERPTTFVVSEVKQNPEKLLTIRYDQNRLSTHIQALITKFKDLDRRLMSSGCISLAYNHLMNGLNHFLLDGEYELRETNVYLTYLNDVLARADK